MAFSTYVQRVYRIFASVKTGIILLIVLGIVAATGTFILQRPITDPQQIERTYSPQTLYWLDKLGLTDVFHAWWFLALMTLLAITIVCASIDRWPQAWKRFAHCYRYPEPHFRAVLPLQQKIPIHNADFALDVAARAFRQAGLKPQQVVTEKQRSLYAEKNRLSVFGVYIVHASLLLILAGGIVDGLVGYKSFVALEKGQSTNVLQLRDGSRKAIPFSLRCDGAGQENYPDGSPRKWWSKLVVLEDGKEIERKEIVVNDPLVYRGIRFYQASYGSTGQLERLVLKAWPKSAVSEKQQITLAKNESVALDAKTSVRMLNFVPDFVIREGEIYTRSEQPRNPAIELEVTSKNLPQPAKVWLFPEVANAPHSEESPYEFSVVDFEMGVFTGLQVSYEPGQWMVWAGCLLMALGLGSAFYAVHRRFWAVAVRANDAAAGNGLVLWLGTQADKNREHYAEELERIANAIRHDLAAREKDSKVPENKKEHSLAAV
ncbi:MAG TPA: cytochrome c biogenesis protein ResB [Terriglobales bacterium]|nr:cytochrome c biogenesis protein ResB [Terriglobales bacterium]